MKSANLEYTSFKFICYSIWNAMQNIELPLNVEIFVANRSFFRNQPFHNCRPNLATDLYLKKKWKWKLFWKCVNHKIFVTKGRIRCTYQAIWLHRQLHPSQQMHKLNVCRDLDRYCQVRMILFLVDTQPMLKHSKRQLYHAMDLFIWIWWNFFIDFAYGINGNRNKLNFEADKKISISLKVKNS